MAELKKKHDCMCNIDKPISMEFFLFDGVQRHFQQNFSYIVAGSFIGRGNRMTRRKPPTRRKAPQFFGRRMDGLMFF